MAIVLNGTTGITNDGGYTGDGIVFADTTPSNTLVTTTGGNVGIGTSSPGAKLDIQGGNIVVGTTTAGNSTASMTFGKVAAGGGTISNRISLATYGGAYGAYIEAYADLSASTATYLAFGTQAGGGGTPTERARIDSSGRLLVDCTTEPFSVAGIGLSPGGAGYFTRSSAASIWASRLTTTGDLIALGYAGVQRGSISTNGSSISYNTSSDYRLKNTIAPMTGALQKVALLKPCTYKWNADGADGQGFIAHELAEVVPDCVQGEKDAVDAEGNPQYQGIDTSFLVATLTAAIQEQQAIITALTARVEALEGTQP
jgi:hypothetical protein